MEQFLQMDDGDRVSLPSKTTDETGRRRSNYSSVWSAAFDTPWIQASLSEILEEKRLSKYSLIAGVLLAHNFDLGTRVLLNGNSSVKVAKVIRFKIEFRTNKDNKVFSRKIRRPT